MIKQLVFVALLIVIFSEQCTSKLVIQCQQDLHLAYQQCEKAAKEKGSDQTADINCIKFLMSSKKDCWPCICQTAQRWGWKVRGCDALKKIGVDLVREFQRKE